MTMYGEVNMSLHSFITSRQMELSDSRIHASTALPPTEGEYEVCTWWKAGRILEPFRTLWAAALSAATVVAELLCHFATAPSGNTESEG